MLHGEFNKNSFFLFYDTLDNLLDQSSVWYPTALEKIQEEFPELSARQTPIHFYFVWTKGYRPNFWFGIWTKRGLGAW